MYPRRQIEPLFDQDINAWLQALADHSFPALLAWLAAAVSETHLKPLILVGTPGSGKSLLARGLSKLWTDGALEASDLPQFDGDYPLIILDEARDLSGIHDFCGRIGTVEEKCRPRRPARGVRRVIVTTNDEVEVQHNPLILFPDQGAVHCLDAFPLDGWEDEKIAAHALWLVDHLGHVLRDWASHRLA